MRNFSSACAMSVALNSNVIYRLKTVWSVLTKSEKSSYDNLKSTFSPGSTNWGILRELHKSAVSPAILHSGLFLQDLIAIEETACDEKNGKINLKKLLVVHERIGTLCMYQQEKYMFAKHALISDMLANDFQRQAVEYAEDTQLYVMCKIANTVDSGGKK